MDLASNEFWKAVGPILTVFITGLGAVCAWFANEHKKRQTEEYQRKEERYRELLLALRGFYATTPDTMARQRFLDQINLCWLYSPDEVIRRLYAFMLTVSTEQASSDQEKEQVLGELVLAIRQDLLHRKTAKRTQLSALDFRPLAVNQFGDGTAMHEGSRGP